MPARRFFVDGVRTTGTTLLFGDRDAHKVRNVLRLKSGDRIEIVDASAGVFEAILDIDKTDVRATLLEGRVRAPAAGWRVDVAQALLKGQKMDFVVEKSTELGVATVMPFSCERTIPAARAPGRCDRWKRLAVAAAAQCARDDVPRIDETRSFEALLSSFASYDRVWFAWEHAPHAPLRDALAHQAGDVRRVLGVVGPEGGFTQAEAEAARDRGAAIVSLGKRILRAETAAIALLAVIDAFAS